jgi:hypothetical protein
LKILLIQPSRYLANGRLDKQKRRWLLGMTVPYVVSLTPPDVRVEIKDDLIEEVTTRESCDLVGFSIMTPHSSRAFELAAGFSPPGNSRGHGGFSCQLRTG